MKAVHTHPIYSRFHGLVVLGFLFGVVYGVFFLSLPLPAGSAVALFDFSPTFISLGPLTLALPFITRFISFDAHAYKKALMARVLD